MGKYFSVRSVPWSGLLYSYSRAELAKPTLAGEQKGRIATFATMIVCSSIKHSRNYSLRGQKEWVQKRTQPANWMQLSFINICMLYFKYATIAANPWEILLCSKTSSGTVHMHTYEKRDKKTTATKARLYGTGLLECRIFLTL